MIQRSPLFRHQHQILRRAHQKLIVTGSAFQSGPGAGAEEVQLGFDFGQQTADAVAVIIAEGFHLREGNFPKLKLQSLLNSLRLCVGR